MIRPARVLILTQYFPPDSGAAAIRLFEMAKLLVAQGIEVEVVSALPNYPLGRIFDEYRGKLFVVEELEGIRVVRSPIFPTRSARLIPRMACYLSFVFSSMLFGLLLTKRPSVVLCESPPLFLGLSGWFLKLAKRCRLIFNVSDLWPETAVRLGTHDKGAFIWLARQLESFCYHVADATTAQSVGIVQGIREKRPTGMVELIPNGCDCELFHPGNRCHELLGEHNVDGKIIVGFAGLVGLAQGIDVLIDVAERLRADQTIHFLIAGDGPDRERIEAELVARKLPNVTFTGWLPRSAMPAVVASFDIAFIPLRYFIPGALPSKIYEAMATETPILLAAAGDSRELLERADAGIAVDYGDVDGIVAAVRDLAGSSEARRRLGSNGRKFVLAHHQRRDIAAKLAKVIQHVSDTPRAALRRAA